MIERANFAVIRQQWALVTFSPRSFENSASAGGSIAQGGDRRGLKPAEVASASASSASIRVAAFRGRS